MRSKTTRRNFIRKAAQGLTAAALTSAVSNTYPAEPEFAGSNQAELQLGMASYTFREFGLEETLIMTKRLGLKRIAFKDFHLPLDSTAEEIRATAARVRRDGLELYGCGVVYMKTRAEVDRAFAYAQAAGMSIIIGVPEHALVSYVGQKIKASGIKVAIHNHGPGDEVYPTPQSAYDKIKALDLGFGLCVDVGHTLRAGVDPARSILDLADRVLDVHIKDVTAATGDGRTVEMGRGVVDLPAVCKALRSIRFGGTVAFEFEKDGKDPLPGVAESVGYIRGVLAVI